MVEGGVRESKREEVDPKQWVTTAQNALRTEANLAFVCPETTLPHVAMENAKGKLMLPGFETNNTLGKSHR